MFFSQPTADLAKVPILCFYLSCELVSHPIKHYNTLPHCYIAQQGCICCRHVHSELGMHFQSTVLQA